MATEGGFVKWSINPTWKDFISLDLGTSNLERYEVDDIRPGKFGHRKVSQFNKIPPLSAYDWSSRVKGLVGIGTPRGEVNFLRIDEENANDKFVCSPRIPRSCQAVAFSTENLVAAGFDKVRNDSSLYIWDLNHQFMKSGWDETKKGWHGVVAGEAVHKLEPAVAVTSIKFFEDQPKTLVVGIKNQCVKIYDLRGG